MKTNIALFLNNDIHAATALRLLWKDLEGHNVKIIISKGVGNSKSLPGELLEMINFEWLDIAEEFSDGFSGEFTEESQLEVSSYDNINSEIALKDLKDFAPQLAISIRFGQIFKQEAIDLFPLGILNLHSGILPDYRGIMASFWAILSGEKTIGMTLHYIINAGIDNGDIIGFSRQEVNFECSLTDNINGLYDGGCELIKDSLQKILSGKSLQTICQKSLKDGGYFSYPKSDEIKQFLSIMSLVD